MSTGTAIEGESGSAGADSGSVEQIACDSDRARGKIEGTGIGEIATNCCGARNRKCAGARVVEIIEIAGARGLSRGT